jgi:predicted nucleic acid-binding protein
MNGTKFVLDTVAVINYLNHRITLEGLDEAELFVSVITELELFSKPGITSGEEETIRSFLSENAFVVELNERIKKETISLRRKTKIKLPDAIVVATSIILGTTLLTFDDQLLKLTWPGYKTQSIF